MNVRLSRDLFSRWIIIHPHDDGRAWSGSRFVPITSEGMPITVQVCNFNSKKDAELYCEVLKFTVVA